MEMLTSSPASRLFVFTDLDDTIFQSSIDVNPELSITATVDNKGNAYAHSSVQQQKLLDVLVASDATIIPVTGRTTTSFLKCTLPVILNNQYSVVSHGAVILDESYSLLKEWHSFLIRQFNLNQWADRLMNLCDHLTEHFALRDDVRVRLIIDQGIAAYVCVKVTKHYYSEDKSVEIQSLLDTALQKDMRLHGNGRNFAILPPYAQKKVAVEFIKEKLGVAQHDTVIGVGDSHSDLPFMKDSDFLIVPRDAQLLREDKYK